MQGSFWHMKISTLLPSVKRPSRYLGTEVNARRKAWEETELRTAMVFPDLYEIGMSHLGLQILYNILNHLDWCLADRAYCPDHDMEAQMRRHRVPAWGLESRKPLNEFDILAFTLPYELCYVNILTILDLAGIPLMSSERTNGNWPLILGGGSCSMNPEPVADFFDAVLAGDGEEAIVEIAQCVREWKQSGSSDRLELLEALSGIEGIYIPSFYQPAQTETHLVAATPSHRLAGTVRRRILPSLHQSPYPSRPIVPFMQIVHDRLGIEIARGCTRGCRFCQAGIIYRPVRERPVDEILTMADRGIGATGWDELSLLSLSTGDYSCLFPLIKELMDTHGKRHVSISLPSLRVGTLTSEIMEEIKTVRKTGFTLAPEAGSERLRRVINKGITEDDLLETAALAYAHGWSHMKLYFMIGLPTETIEDVEAIATLAKKVRGQGSSARGRTRKRQQVTASIGTFVPKPHTPFQWERQIDPEESRFRINIIRKTLRGKAFNVKWHDHKQSFLEGIFSRGDRRLSRIILRAWRQGARLDAWTDSMRPDLYLAAGREEGIDLTAYLNEIPEESRLPWDHIQSGVDRNFIIKEREKAWQEAYTSDCRQGKCHRCGVCDFKTIRPVVFVSKDKAQNTTKPCTDTVSMHSLSHSRKSLPPIQRPKYAASQRHFCRLRYSKTGPARFLGHLEMVHAFHRAARRAGLPVAYSTGFHPMPRVAFGQPLSLGMESLMEEAMMELSMPTPASRIMESLNDQLPEGLRINEARLSNRKDKISEPQNSRYLIWVKEIEIDTAERALQRFQQADKVMVHRERKGKTSTIDAKNQVEELVLLKTGSAGNQQSCRSFDHLTDQERSWLKEVWRETEDPEGTRGSAMLLISRSSEGPVLKPHEIIAAVTGCCDNLRPTELFRKMHILKSWMDLSERPMI